MTTTKPELKALSEAIASSKRGYADVAVNKTKPCIICEQEAHGDLIFDAAIAYLNHLAEPTCCGSVGKEYCWKNDCAAEECPCKRAVIDDAGLAEAVEYCQERIKDAEDDGYTNFLISRVETIINHAVKGEKVEEVTIDRPCVELVCSHYNGENTLRPRSPRKW